MTYGFVGTIPTQNKRTGNKGVLTTNDIIQLKSLDQLDGWGDDMLKIATSDITNQASIDFTGCDGTRDYILVWNNVTFSSSGGYFQIRLSDDNGSTFSSSNFYDNYNYYIRGTTDTYGVNAGDQTSLRIGISTNNQTGNCFNGWLHFDSYQDFDNGEKLGTNMRGFGTTINTASSTSIEGNSYNCRYKLKNYSANAIQVFSSTASMSGRFTLYQKVWVD